MTSPRTSHSATCQIGQQLAATLLWLLLPMGLAWGQATTPALEHLVRPTPGTRPLGAVLAELSRQGRLPLSYSSSLVPVAHPCTLRPGPPRPLGVVLREVLAAERLSYGLLAGQLVVWPDDAAGPAGVAAENSRAGPPVQPPPSPGSAGAAPTGGRAVVVAKTAAAANVASPPHPALRPGPGSPGSSSPLNPAKRTWPAASAKLAANRSSTGTAAVAPAARRRAALSSPPGPQARHLYPVVPAGRVPAKPLGEALSAALPRGGPGRARPLESAARGVAAWPPSPAPGTGSPQHRSGPVRGPLARLPFRLPVPTSVSAPGAALLGQEPVSLPLAPGPRPAAGAAQSTDSAAPKPPALAGLLRRGYLHGEAWGSESLPLNAAVKLGLPRLYLVLGAAAGPFDHQSGGAWGAGLGTTGRTRGRFTPSLDLLQWFLAGPGDEEAAPGRLTQLRPALAWQLRRGGRWQLVGGPTLNLAAAHRAGTRTRWALGQDQWLWLDSAEQESLLRLWPGVQLGVHF